MMEDTSLHTQKLAILSRLIKESSLTLEEALLLLKEETVSTFPMTTPGYFPPPTYIPKTGSGNMTPWFGMTPGLEQIFHNTSGTGTLPLDLNTTTSIDHPAPSLYTNN